MKKIVKDRDDREEFWPERLLMIVISETIER